MILNDHIQAQALKAPPQEVIAAGYAMMRAYNEFMDYSSTEYPLTAAIEAVRKAIETMRAATWADAKSENDRSGNENAHGVFYNETGKPLALLYEAASVQFELVHMRGQNVANHFAVAAGREKIRWAHFELWQALERYGYRAPYKRELNLFGATGDR